MRSRILAIIALVALFAGCSERLTEVQKPSFNQFVVGERVKTIRAAIVRSTASAFAAPNGTAAKDATGTIVAPAGGQVDAAGDNTRYWNVDFDGAGPDGWVSGIYLTSVTENGVPTTEFWVSPTGSAANPGTQASPWSLSWAMDSANHAAVAGSTIWMLNGTYAGNYHTTTKGNPTQRIVYRQAAGARATIDGQLYAQGEYLTFWGFEIKQSQPSTLYGLEAQTNNGRYINLVIHDAGTMGISIWYPPGDTTEIYGCLVYNNGTNAGANHGAYIESTAGYRILRDNVFFNNTAYGIYAFTVAGGAPQNNIYAIGNASFNNGSTAYAGWGYTAKPNITIGAQAPVPSDGMRADSNFTYFSIHPSPSEWNLKLGTGLIGSQSQNGSLLARGNTSWAGIALRVTDWTTSTVAGNTLFAPGASRLVDLVDPTMPGQHSWSGNTYLIPATTQNWYWMDQWYDLNGWQTATGLGATGTAGTIPSTPTVLVRANKYESGRALIIVNNDNGASGPRVSTDITVSLPSGILTSGQTYFIRNTQDIYNYVATGTYNGSSITITAAAMAGGTPPALLGTGRTWGTTPPTTGPRFNAFILTTQ